MHISDNFQDGFKTVFGNEARQLSVVSPQLIMCALDHAHQWGRIARWAGSLGSEGYNKCERNVRPLRNYFIIRCPFTLGSCSDVSYQGRGVE